MIEKGFYIYVGSAFGAGGLSSRLHRHLRKRKKIHWHIDQLTTSLFCTVYGVAVFLNEKIECDIAQKLSKIEATVPMMNVGNSDCINKCSSHLFKVEM